MASFIGGISTDNRQERVSGGWCRGDYRLDRAGAKEQKGQMIWIMKWLGWVVVYLAMWMVASVIITLLFHWPIERMELRLQDPYFDTVPGQTAALIGLSLPSAATGAVLGPLGPLVVAMQESGLSYGEEFDRVQRTHPRWSTEQCAASANEAGKVPAISAILLGYAVIAIAWLIRPRAAKR